jgi:hypothetical protein
MLEDAIAYPWRGEQRVKTLVIGGILSVFYWVIIPGLVLQGYQLRVFRQVCAGDTEVPPAFDTWGRLLGDGLVGMVITLVYGVGFMTPFGLSVVVFLPFAGRSADSGGALAIAGVAVALLVTLIAFAIGLTVIYLVPAALAAYAVTGDISSAFSPSTLWTIGSDRSYLLGVVTGILLNAITQVVGTMLVLTIVGILLLPFIGFYGSVAGVYAIGAGVADTPFVADQREPDSTRGR